jgi:hypothetical protein
MIPEPKRPFSVRCCAAMISIAARLVPESQRRDWEREWQAEIWHHWQFLLHAGEWSGRESRRLVRTCLGALPDAAWHLTSQQTVQNRVRERLRSPWTCVAGLGVLLLVLALATSWFPATRSLFAFQKGVASERLLFIWLHPSAGGGDEGLPSDLPPAWRWRSQLLESVSGFSAAHRRIQPVNSKPARMLVVAAERNLFRTLEVRPILGSVSQQAGVVLTDAAWRSLFQRDPKAIGARVRIGTESYRVAAVLPASFRFLTREPAAYLLEPFIAAYPPTRLMVIARVKPGVSIDRLDHELTRIAESATYYFFSSEFRYASLHSTIWTPVSVFGIAVLLSALFVTAVSRVRLRRLRFALRSGNRQTSFVRAGFFVAKAGLALALVFLTGLEWTRTESALVFASWDPANGPFLVWLYILGSMAVLFWSLADQRARCRVCLRLLCFPVRIGCPGCLLLDWSGTELLCTEGHGVLHVPHLVPSWDEESDHWIALDDSWQELFVHTR